MKKPIHGDELTIRYDGQMVRAKCNDVTELPARALGVARFTIVSKTPFRRGTGAALMDHGSELEVNVERVTSMPHKGINIVSFVGLFDTAPAGA